MARSVYEWSCWSCRASDIRLATVVTTDASGLATVVAPSSGSTSTTRVRLRRALYVQSPSGSEVGSVLLDNVQPGPSVAGHAPKGVVITDRSLYKEGDVVYIKGYVRSQTGERMVVPSHKTEFKVLLTCT